VNVELHGYTTAGSLVNAVFEPSGAMHVLSSGTSVFTGSAFITNPSIEQTTNQAHVDESIGVGGKTTTGSFMPFRLDTSGNMILSTLVPFPHDYIHLDYAGALLGSAIYRTGGSGGTTVATVVLAYSGTALTDITRT